MIIHLNGWPGVGKLTVARCLRDLSGGRLLDNHTVFNVAFALTDFRSPEFYDTARAARDTAFDCAARLPADVPLIMTNALSDSDWGRENWDAVRALATRRNVPLFAVILTCDEHEQAKRMSSPEREYLGKLSDPKQFSVRGRTLIADGADHLIRLDTTSVPADETARSIWRWTRDTAST